ncbi:tetratricopeptide repeat protein [Mangrovimonas sp. YM274]|uniref:tetratricopeptide repeat protein n=1 Tax=Mangrovimonas sp. YM274 TaxID=3070660 RepID=UPI0027DE1F56|nr:tetratricopeptide repeat protein [Mangrovimonas sp. YM274]WMI69949.1 tetratricopeptide repeat protein [Mangrovimonas sp. YM274]
MKTKLILLVLSSLTIIVTFIHFNNTEEAYKYPDQVGLNAISCTPANFMLEDIDFSSQISPLFENLGNHTYTVSTQNDMAQKFFNQGLRLTYGFNHAEAHRSFMEASRLDPDLAMAYWGQAYVLGPNINDPAPDDDRKTKANEAIAKALELSVNSTQKEQDLINALNHRYSTNLTTDIQDLNLAYMEAMSKVANTYTSDSDIQTLYAASVMNTVPWNYWDKSGKPSANIPEAKAALEKAIELDPNNPGAHHYYIHMVELPKPDLAVPSAEKLGTLMPSAGHLVHMPSHIYIRVGRYKDAVIANQKAIIADEDYISQCYAQGMYPLGYYPHNIHFLWSASSLLGASEIAIDAAKKTAEKVPVGEMKDLHFLQNFASTPLLAYTRFGKWNDILTTPKPNSEIKHLSLIWHYTRGIAFIRKHNIIEAEEELEAISVLIKDPDMETNLATGFDSGTTIAKLAYEVVAGELEAEKGNLDSAISHLEKAVEIEDNLVYNEPSEWHIPPRQNLGAVLLKAEQYEEAEKVYKQDLENLRQNGWSLIGLHKSLLAQDKIEEAQAILNEFNQAWSEADIRITSSVL